MKSKLKVGNHRVENIYYLSASELHCSFEREYDAQSGCFMDLVVYYDDFADEDSKWIFSDCKYNSEGVFIDVVDCTRLEEDDKKAIKDFIVEYFNRNYDITELLETDIVTPNDTEYDTEHLD